MIDNFFKLHNLIQRRGYMQKKCFSQKDLERIYNDHKKWLENEENGKRAECNDAKFEKLDFAGMNFEKAVFKRCSFNYSTFENVSFKDAVLSYSDFSKTHFILEKYFKSSILTGCNFGDVPIFRETEIEKYENQYLKYQKIYILSFVVSLISFLFSKYLYGSSINILNLDIKLTHKNIGFVTILSSFLSCIIFFYFLKINAKNLTEKFLNLPKIFPNGSYREDKINNSFIKSLFDIQNKDIEKEENTLKTYLKDDFYFWIKSAICIEHNIGFFSLAIFLMSFFGITGSIKYGFTLPLAFLPLFFTEYRKNYGQIYKIFLSSFCICFISHSYLHSLVSLIIAFLLYPSGFFFSRAIIFFYAVFVSSVIYTYSLLPIENFSVQEFNTSCDRKNYFINEIAGVKFNNMDLNGLKAVSIDFSDTSFNNSNLSNADLRCSRFENASFLDAILDNADLRGAHITNASICGAKSYSSIKTDTPVSCVRVPISK